MQIELSEPMLLALRLIQAILDQGCYDELGIGRMQLLKLDSGYGDDTHILFHVEGEYEHTSITGAVHLDKDVGQTWSESNAWASLKLGSNRYAAQRQRSHEEIRIFRPLILGGKGEAVAIARIEQLSE